MSFGPRARCTGMMNFDDPQLRRALHVHCYRMVGSFSDADDLVQEALLRAWRARDSFDAGTGELGLRRWLYRIATNACLDFLRDARRTAPSLERSFAEVPWLEPYPDRLLDELPAASAGPEAETARKETIALGYLALIQILPPQQRAVLVLRDVQGWSAAEVADALELTVAAANSSLQRARETVAKHAAHMGVMGADAGAMAVAEPAASERAILAAFIDAHERGDRDASRKLLAPDFRVTMPPQPMIFVGLAQWEQLADTAWGRPGGAPGMGDWRLVAAWANRMPAALSYLRRPGDSQFRAFKIDVLRVERGIIREITTFDPRLVGTLGQPEVLP